MAFAVALALPARALGDATDERRALVMLRALAYDKNLPQRAGDEVRIAVGYATGDERAAEKWIAAFAKVKKLKVDGRAIVVVLVRLDSGDALGKTMAAMRPAALVVCEGATRKISVAQLAKVTRAHKVLSFTTREPEVVGGLAVGVVPGKSRDEIVINARAVAAEGVRFDAGLLALARAVKEQP